MRLLSGLALVCKQMDKERPGSHLYPNLHSRVTVINLPSAVKEMAYVNVKFQDFGYHDTFTYKKPIQKTKHSLPVYTALSTRACRNLKGV